MKSISSSGRYESKINILEVIGNANMGGMENYMDNFLRHLNPNLFQVTCICPYESNFTTSLREKGFQVYITPIEDDPPWRSIQLTAEVGRLHQVDVLHAHMPKAHVLAGIAGLMLNKNVVATVHGMNITSHELGITRAVGSQLITNCQEAYFQALAMGVSADRVFRASNGVDISIFTPENDGQKLRDSINVPADTPLIGFAGRLEHEKGPDLFLRVAQLIHFKRPDVHFVVIGEGSMACELHEMCSEFGIDENVHFLGWKTNMQDFYPGLDLLVHTSRSDGTSLVLLEAMACGCPATAMAVGGLREIVENQCTGIIQGAGDWEGMSYQILRLLQQPEKLQKMGKAARIRVEKYFDVKKNTEIAGNILKRFAYKPPKGNKYIDKSILQSEINSLV